MLKRYIVYINTLDDFKPIRYGCRRFKITAWLQAKKIKYKFDDVNAIIYDRKKGEIVYEK